MEFFKLSSPYYHPDNQQLTSGNRYSDTKIDHFIVDDLLDFPTDDIECGPFVADTSADSSTAVGSSNSSSRCGGTKPSRLPGDDDCRRFVDNQFSSLYTPYDDLAEFEWLSNFVEESFSNEDVHKLHLLPGFKPRPEYTPEPYQLQPKTINQTNNMIFNNDMKIPGKARTKRSRVTSCNWATRLPVVSPSVKRPVSNMSSDSKPDTVLKNEEGRKCAHCATDKTPQWRTGPTGPRTLCNACGVRYKSGRLVPEYRPAASPTFVLAKHSNSHRKVLELRRQKMQKTLHHQQHFVNHHDVRLQMSDNYFIHHH
ncbi:hypothetical protein SSX86_001127 [Deinandra increscens subsp. villosa]|uniref:GATA transcription factor n=1 Tax=Deinandra increscens subsp. villosa TaxID=3103831 RepID=A0AAP0HC99_9ASTR